MIEIIYKFLKNALTIIYNTKPMQKMIGPLKSVFKSAAFKNKLCKLDENVLHINIIMNYVILKKNINIFNEEHPTLTKTRICLWQNKCL